MKDKMTIRMIFGTGIVITLLFIATMILADVQGNLTLKVTQVTEYRNKIISSKSTVSDRITLAAVSEDSAELKDIEDVLNQQTESLASYLELIKGSGVEDQIEDAINMCSTMSSIETDAIALIKGSDWSSALELMRSKDYLSAKKTFSDDVVDTIDTINTYFSNQLDGYTRIINIINFLKLIASFLLILICFWFYIRAKRAINKQKKLAAEIEEANALLEMRINERTGELSAALSEMSVNKEKLQMIMDSAAEGIYGADTNGKITFCNQALLQMLSMENEEELVGHTAHERIHKYFTDEETECPICRAVAHGKLYAQEFVRWKVENSAVHWVKVTANPMYQEDRHSGTVLTIVDVTAQHEINEALARAKEAADNANQLKSDFLANMSHEIRTPMNAILGMCHLTLRTELLDKQRNYIEKVQFSAQSLLEIINDILDFSKIEAGKLQMEKGRFDLEDVISHATDLIAVKAQEKNIALINRIEPGFSHIVVGDKLRLGQVITNLLSNAIKFTEKGSISLSVEKVSESRDKVKLKFTVADTGIGLSIEQQGRLFQAFTQADTSTTRKYGGTGLGLAISKSIVTLMNGEIGVDSVYQKGSTFWFTAEFVKYDMEKTELLEQHISIPKLKILVADDDEESREMMRNILESFRFEVNLASSGAKALAMLESTENEHKFDLVILDYLMPDMDGFEVFEKMKNSDSDQTRPKTIMLTAYGREEISKRADQSGIEGFLVKPVNTSVLLDMIMQLTNSDVKSFDYKSETKNLSLNLSILRNAKVLLVEDNEVNQELALDILNEVGIQVTVAENGSQAIDHIHGENFDLVLMDCQMPVMDGYEATKLIRKENQYDMLPVIAMTANAIEGERDRCYTAGMNDYVSKPIDIESFLQTLCMWMPLTRSRKAEITDTAQTEKNGTPLPEFAVLDSKAGIAYANGSEALYRSVLQKFMEGNLDFSERFRKAMEVQAYEDAKRLAHTIKGLAGSIAAGDLHKEAEILEKLCIDNQTEQYENQLKLVGACLEEVFKDIRKLQSASGEEDRSVKQLTVQENLMVSGELRDQEHIMELLQQLRSYLEQDNSLAIKTYDDITKAVKGTNLEDVIKPLSRHIKNYDFETALSVFPKWDKNNFD